MCKKMDYDGASVDIWAAGILFFTILMGYQPFKAGTEQELFKKIIKGNITYPKSCHPDFTGGQVSTRAEIGTRGTIPAVKASA